MPLQVRLGNVRHVYGLIRLVPAQLHHQWEVHRDSWGNQSRPEVDRGHQEDRPLPRTSSSGAVLRLAVERPGGKRFGLSGRLVEGERGERVQLVLWK